VKRTIVISAAAALLAVTAGEAQATHGIARATTLTLGVQTSGKDPAWNAVASNFMKANPGVEVKLVFAPLTTYGQSL